MTETIHTLQEFMLRTKGIVYILAIGYLLGFVWFWKFMFRRDKAEEE